MKTFLQLPVDRRRLAFQEVDASEAMIAHTLVGLFALDPFPPMDGTLTAFWGR